jgi:hypothetical protein
MMTEVFQTTNDSEFRAEPSKGGAPMKELSENSATVHHKSSLEG